MATKRSSEDAPPGRGRWWGPLYERVRLGEGVLLAVAASLVWLRAPGVPTAVGQGVVALVVLALLYAWNDVADAARDRRNPKKNPELVAHLLQRAVRDPRRAWLLAKACPGVFWIALLGATS